MKSIILSIKPIYSKKILEESKKIEIRKKNIPLKINKVYIYETSPTMKVVGEAMIEKVEIHSPQTAWNLFSHDMGIDYKSFMSYLKNHNECRLIFLKEVKKYSKEKTLEDFKINFSPQSFVYYNSSEDV